MVVSTDPENLADMRWPERTGRTKERYIDEAYFLMQPLGWKTAPKGMLFASLYGFRLPWVGSPLPPLPVLFEIDFSSVV